MDKLEYDRLRQRIEDRKAKGIKAVEDRYQEEVRSLENVWRMIQEDGDTASPTTSTVGQEARPQPVSIPVVESADTADKGPTAMVREAIQELHPPFGMPDVCNWIADRYPAMANLPRVSISSALSKLTKGGELEVVSLGAGRNPALYKRKDRNTAQSTLMLQHN